MAETEGPGSEGKTTAFDIEKAHSQHKVGCALSFCYDSSGGAMRLRCCHIEMMQRKYCDQVSLRLRSHAAEPRKLTAPMAA